MHKKRMDVPFEVKQISEDENFFTFEGYAATFGNVDRGGDRIIKGAFVESIKELKKRSVKIGDTGMSKLMPVLWQHKHSDPIGSFVEMKEDDKGLFVKGILPKDDDLVRGRVMPQMKSGSISDMSIGYRIIDRSVDSDDVWNLEKLELFETSLVTIPMNTEANVTEFKSAAYESVEVADRREHIDTDGATKRMDGNDDAFIGEHVIADMVDEKFTIFPNAVFKASAAVQSGRASFSEEDMDALGAIYEKMGLESPFGKKYLLGVHEAETLTHRQFEKFLFASRCFSKEAAKVIASKFKPVVRDADGDKSERDAAQKVDEKCVSSKLDQILSLFEKENPNGTRRN